MKHLLLFVLLIFMLVQPIFGQKKYDIKTIAFYNLENLYDIVDDTLKFDESSPIMAIKENRAAIYQLKLNNMAKVLSEIGTEEAKNSPVIIGVAEIENYGVLDDLVNTPYLKDKQYGIIHYDSQDLRGIDVGLL